MINPVAFSPSMSMMDDTPSQPIINFNFAGIASRPSTTLTQPQQQASSASPPQVQQLSQMTTNTTQPTFGYFVPQNTNVIQQQQPQTTFVSQNVVGQQQPQSTFIQPQQAQQQIPVWTNQQQQLSPQYQQPILSQFPQTQPQQVLFVSQFPQQNQQLSPPSQFPQDQQQYSFGYRQEPQPQGPVYIQPVYMPIIVQQPHQEQIQPFAVGNGAIYDPKKKESWDGFGSLPSSFFRSALLGHGPSILTPDPSYRSPMFEWSQHPNSGRTSITGINSDVFSTLLKPPGLQILENAKLHEWSQVFNDQELRTLLKIPHPKSRTYYFKDSPPVGLFEQRNQRDWSDLSPPCPPKRSEGIDPITGLTDLERLQMSDNKKRFMRSKTNLNSGVIIDTIFDLPLSNSNASVFDTPAFSTSSLASGGSTGLLGKSLHIPKDQWPNYKPPISLSVRELHNRCPSGVKLTKPGYSCIPDLHHLDYDCAPNDFTVRHVEFGEVIFPGKTNVAGLDLDSIIHFSHKNCVLYPDPSMKPEYGQGLNKKAIVTLYKVWPTCRVTGQIMRDPADLNNLNYKEVLLKNCRRFSGKFLSYSPTTGNWVFEIQSQN